MIGGNNMWIESKRISQLTFIFSFGLYVAILLSPMLGQIEDYYSLVVLCVAVVMSFLGTIAWMIAFMHSVFVRWWSDHSLIGWPMALLLISFTTPYYVYEHMLRPNKKDEPRKSVDES